MKHSVDHAFYGCTFCFREYNKSQVINMKKMLFVMNPISGTKKAARHLANIVNTFNRADYQVQLYLTAAPGDGKDYVAKNCQDADVVVCCGGDGTFNETVSGLVACGREIPIGYIPAGSTNDFANSLGLPLTPVDAAKAIVEGAPKAVDLGKFGDRYFSYVASFGAFTRASYATPQSMKNALGHTAYVLGGITELAQIRATHMKLTVDGEEIEDDFIFGAVCNSTSVGGILTLDPEQVDMSDGLFEVFLIRAPKDLAELGEFFLAVQKKQYNCKMMTFLSGRKVTAQCDEPISWTLDGEEAEGAPVVEIENLHHAYSILKREDKC